MLICPVIFGKFPHSFPFYKIKNRFESGIRPPGLEHVFVALHGGSFIYLILLVFGGGRGGRGGRGGGGRGGGRSL